MVKKYQQKFRKIKEGMSRWEELQCLLISQFSNASSIIQRIQVIQNSQNYGALRCVDGIEGAVLANQMDSLQTALVSINNTMKEFRGIVSSLEKVVRDSKQLVKAGSAQQTAKQLKQRIGVKPTLEDCLEGFRLLDEMHQSEYLLKLSVVSALPALALKPRTGKGDCHFGATRTKLEFSSYFRLEMRFMDEEESWELLRRKVFGEEQDCPPQLVKPGKKIADKCEGLPLLINTVAPILLSKAQKDPECWNRVAQKPDPIVEAASHQISQLLLKSCNQIKEQLEEASHQIGVLMCYAFRGEKWEAKNMRFSKLRYLLIEDTDLVHLTAGAETFTLLSVLTIKNCHKLREIPIGVLVCVELIDCNPIAETWAKQNYSCRVKYSWKEKVKRHDDF